MHLKYFKLLEMQYNMVYKRFTTLHVQIIKINVAENQ